MKMLKSLLLGSAAGLATVAGAQAADLPVKAKPVEYVKVCSLYGAGFWYIPGTDTCIKIGGFVRAQVNWNAGNGSAPLGQGSFSDASAGLDTRTDTSNLTYVVRGLMGLDLRTQTEYGTLRSYAEIGTQQQSVSRWGGASAGLSIVGTPPSNQNSNFFNEGTDVTRAFVQFAGFTAGRIRSFFDIVSFAPYSLDANRINADTGAAGLFGVAYTQQFANGISASVSFEDPGSLINGRGMAVYNANFVPTSVVNGVAQLNGLGGWGGALGAGAPNDYAGITFMDPVLALRIDQAWGFAQVSGALHDDFAGYYGTAIGGGVAGTPAIPNGHPADEFGWAITGGFTLTNVLGLKGDSFALQAAYGKGASGYVNKSNVASVLVGSGNKLTATWNVDNVYGCFNGACSQELTTNWSIDAAYEHVWTPKWKTSVFGGYTGISYDQTAKNMICPVQGGGLNANNVSFTAFAPATSNWVCNPNYNTWQVGTRTLWNPHPDLDIGVEVLYTQLNQQNSGTVTLASNQGALPAGSQFTFANQGVWSAFFRVQRNFVYY